MKSTQPDQPVKQSGSASGIFLSSAIPCYNKSARVELMMQGLAEFDEKWKGGYEVIIINDGCKDDKVQKTEAALAGKVQIERMPANGGKGSALKHGVSKTNG